ncbi:hypothetical protein QYF36_021232 [Acer negundo]|nr:hypothetical protein QYF36_021232 [Acer negundo]
MDECRKWNLVWVGRNKLAPLEPDEVEMHLGFPRNHTRGGGIGIGGVEVALHRLGIPLKNVVSVEISEVNRSIIWSWWEQTNQIGTLIDMAEVQQFRGRLIFSSMHWCRCSSSIDALMHVVVATSAALWLDEDELGIVLKICDSLEQLMDSFGGFDLVVGGSPYNNLAGNNRYTRDGLEVPNLSFLLVLFSNMRIW